MIPQAKRTLHMQNMEMDLIGFPIAVIILLIQLKPQYKTPCCVFQVILNVDRVFSSIGSNEIHKVERVKK